MRKTRSASSDVKEDPDAPSKIVKAPALMKVFYIEEQFLNDAGSELRMERFYHPGKGTAAWFATSGNDRIMEVLQFNEPHRSWLINSTVCSNGRIYLTTPIDATFFGLHILRKHCSQKAMELDCIRDEKDAGVTRLLTTFVHPESLACVADVKTLSDSDTKFYKYNAEKALAWLAIKTRRVADVLKSSGVHCGQSALSLNYKRSETAEDEMVHQIDYLRMACDIVGGYIDLDLQEKLAEYLEIPALMQAKVEEKKAAGKRKSLQNLEASNNKKVKLEKAGAAAQLKSSDLLDESVDNESILYPEVKLVVQNTPAKQRVLTTKEKALAKGAKGSKSISSFFKK